MCKQDEHTGHSHPRILRLDVEPKRTYAVLYATLENMLSNSCIMQILKMEHAWIG
jgi:hypothetical protein